MTQIEGARGGYIVVNMDDASQIPAICEPLFLGLNATVQVSPVFALDDMPSVTEAVEQARQKYA
jgi:aspartate/methionine/tyrosine aminotransferase